ncbi:unnamed protein product [Pedinophyceae sp. YPF-701]|nr:unnamed protein product [Pedinophyceae sp. YPF-701]
MVRPSEFNTVPAVITDKLIRSCIQVEGSDEKRDEKRQAIAFADVTNLMLSFQNVLKVENLRGLEALTKLQLDNNVIEKIEGLGHLVNLTWLDLSFNNIKCIEGLENLVNLTDLSLSNNRIETIEGMETLTQLHVLSLGNNLVTSLEGVMYLRQFRRLRMVNLLGNPIASSPEYRPYVLSHIKDLVYLDFRRIDAHEVAAAREQFQDEMIEIEEREEAERHEEHAREEAAVHEAEMRKANLLGVDTLVDDITEEVPEFRRLQNIAGLTDGIQAMRDAYQVLLEEFRGEMLGEYSRKEEEKKEFRTVLDGLLEDRENFCRSVVVEFDKAKKGVLRALSKTPAGAAERVKDLRVQLAGMREQLMDVEMELVENIQALVDELLRNYHTLAERSRSMISAFFQQTRELGGALQESMTREAMAVLDKLASDPPELDLEAMSSEARSLLQDKDQLMSTVQACHDGITSRIDALDDKLVSEEARRAQELSAWYGEWAYKRNRRRVVEISSLIALHEGELEELVQANNEDGV